MTKKSKRGKLVSLKDKLKAIYETVDLSTSCSGHCVCCNVACPQMNHSEFLVLLDEIYNNSPKEKRLEVLKKSVRYFFSQSLIKPCPLLDEKLCGYYEERPLACRLFGLWPEDMYEERVQRFMSVTGMKREEIPLNTQCKYVRRINDSSPITREHIENMYREIDNIDVQIGNYTKDQISKKYNQRTFHDWFMVTVFGEENLSDMSKFFLAAQEKESVDDFVEQMIRQIDIIGDNIFKRKNAR